MPFLARCLIVACLAAAVACATSPTGRRQLTLIPDAQMDAMGAEAFQQMEGETPVEKDPAIDAYVRCVADAITALPRVQAQNRDWEVVVFDQKQTVNAFALPGGKIGVYTGMLTAARTPGQLAAVLGHEVGHVVARHGNERMSQQFAVGETLALIDAWMAAGNRDNRQAAMALLGVGAQVGVLLPFSRTHESEADAIGQELMARAGFDPRESVVLWQNMEKAGGEQPPQFLSTHPAHASRVKALRAELDSTLPLYEEARAAGRRPPCQPPRGERE
jgi:predicted Zn-dependent protease